MDLLWIGIGVVLLILAGAIWFWRSRSDTVIQVPVAPVLQQSSLSQPANTYSETDLQKLEFEGKLVPIESPLVLHSAEQALQKGGKFAHYIVRYQGRLWLTFEAFSDPQERQEAYELFRRLNSGEDLDIRKIMAVIQKIGK